MKRLLYFFLTFIFLPAYAFSQEKLPRPDSFFGFHPGSDRNLFRYEKLIDYLRELDNSSDRLELRQAGKSPEGKPMYIAFISSPENIGNLDELKEVNRRLALDPEISDTGMEELTRKGKVFVLATLSMHASEVGPSQSVPLIAWDLCTTRDPVKLQWLDNVVYMVVPSHNPDGMDMIVDYYNKTRGTKYEGASYPGVYHKYVGHDNNRDFIMLSQSDNKAVARIYNLDWFPQVMVEKHQMGMTGTRYFVPPNHDPIAENIDEGIWTWMEVFGAAMMNDMTTSGLKGISQNNMFDNYWPGSTETCIWKNVIGFLTECASARIATPVYVEPSELRAYGKGLSEYKKSVNMPDPWDGGWWRLSDIVDYEIVSTNSILKTASDNREKILRFRNELCRKEVSQGKNLPPYYYIVPAEQHDQSELVSFVNLMQEQGINLYRLDEDVETPNRFFRKGDVIIPMAQPFRSFIKEVMEKQIYPERHYTPEGDLIKPYDITSWSLPLHNGLKAFAITERITDIDRKISPIENGFTLRTPAVTQKYMVFTSNNNESYKAAFKAVLNKFETLRTSDVQESNGKSIPAGSFIVKTPEKKELETFLNDLTVDPWFVDTPPKGEKFTMPEVGLVETYQHDMDAGWTRYIFDTYHIPFHTIHPDEISNTDLSGYDVIVLPDDDKSVLLKGKYKKGDDYYLSSYAPEYSKGMEQEGLRKILEFVDKGGVVVSWGGSTGLFEGSLSIGKDEDKEEFQFPVNDISDELSKKGVLCPGSLIRMKLSPGHMLTAGMPSETGIFFRGEPVFATGIPFFGIDRRVTGTISGQDILMSGYCSNPEKLANKAVMVWLSLGKGQLVLMGFSPQYRASTHATYKLLFNSLLIGNNQVK